MLPVTYYGAGSYREISFLVWSAADGQDDIDHYFARRDASGVWTVEIPLHDHLPEGTGDLVIYGQGRKWFRRSTEFMGKAVFNSER